LVARASPAAFFQEKAPMFDRIRRSYDLVQASAQVLRQDRHLMLFPLISAVAMVLVALAFLLPVFGLSSIDGLEQNGKLVYSVAFLFYVVQYFVIIYFNTALVGAAMIRLDGGSPTLGDGLRIANGRLPTILGYAVVSATVGVILRAIQERVGFVGRIIVAFIGAGWAAATFLVVPVIVARDRGAFGSISESADLLKRTWGENLVGQGGLGIVFTLLYGALFGVFALFAWLYGPALGPVAIIVALALVALAFLALVLVHSTLTGIYSAAVYRYAAGSSGTPGFDQQVLASAFRTKD
jgi:hypothetical protein